VAQEYRVAIIGCGGRGRAHARAWRSTARCRLVAVSDVVRASAEAFAANEGGPAAPPAVYEDYAQMLREARADIVSVCTWPDTHGPIVAAAAAAGARAIFSEKPMAPTWGEARQMAETARRAGAILAFCHQRRFETQFRAARRLLRAGAIGKLLRIEGTCPNLFDWGTHWFDMFHFYNDEQPAQSVLGQIDLRAGRRVFGVLVEDQGLSLIRFANGVDGLLITGEGRQFPEINRLVGTEGIIETQMPGPDGKWIPVRIRGAGDGAFRLPEILDDDRPGPGGPEGAAATDIIRCLEQGGDPELSATKALRATELIFATYESSRRRARVDLPLQIEDSPLLSMAAAGEIGAGQIGGA
jgi:UDP-N-acetylglucosamine 3-dehydrogenase